MAKIRIVGDSSGYVELAAPNAAGNNTLELPSNATKLVGADASNSLNVTGIATFSSGIVGNVTGNINSSGVSTFSSGINIGTGTSISSPATNVLTLGTNNTESVRIDSSGRLGLNSNLSGAAAYNRLVVNSPDASCWISLQSANTGSTINSDGIDIGLNGSNQGHFWLRENADLLIATNNTERLRIDASGRVTMPSQPAFMAYGNAGLTSYGSGAEFILNATQTNIGNNYSTSTGRFTVPVSGFYAFSYGIYSYATGQMAFKRNGIDYNAGSDALGLFTIPAANGIYGASVKLTLAAGDTVSFGWRTGSSGDVYRSHGWFSGHLVG